MEFSTKVAAPEKLATGALVVGIHENGKASASAAAIDTATGGLIRSLYKRRDFDGKLGSTRVLFKPAALRCERLILVGLGEEAKFDAGAYRKAVHCAVAAVKGTGATEAHLALVELPVRGCDLRWMARQAITVAADALYRFDELKSTKSAAPVLRKLALTLSDRSVAKTVAEGVAEGRAIAAGVAFTRDLGNRPANLCTPSHLARQALALGKSHKLKVSVLERKDMQKLGMGALLAVAQGAHEAPKFIVLQYNGAGKKDKPVVLVGKGVTFDTGGISIKPSAAMDEMKFDMCGAASVLGTFRAIAELGPKLNLVGLIPTTENMPGGGATRPGDIVKTLSGQTVEILNTDAEGRLILCDALTYAERFNPAAVVDIATLTGACVIALGHVASGVYANDENLANELLDAGREAWDRGWHMPLWDDYQEQLKSPFADMANIGGRPAGSVTAACFLSRFTHKYAWAHLDIAGTAWNSGKDKGATGRPVPLLTAYLLHHARRS